MTTLKVLKYFVSRIGHQCNSEQSQTNETAVIKTTNNKYLTVWLTDRSGAYQSCASCRDAVDLN